MSTKREKKGTSRTIKRRRTSSVKKDVWGENRYPLSFATAKEKSVVDGMYMMYRYNTSICLDEKGIMLVGENKVL